MSTLQELIQDFVDQLSATIESQAISRARKAVESALGGRAGAAQFGRIGRLAALKHENGSNGHTNGTSLRRKPRKKPPIQLCPVPGCKERAAPVFGMVCAKHQDVPKAKIKKYREERRAKKVGGSTAAPAARRSKPAAKKRAARKPVTRAKIKAAGKPKNNPMAAKPAQAQPAASASPAA
jgi:hypothetical protein